VLLVVALVRAAKAPHATLDGVFAYANAPGRATRWQQASKVLEW